MSGERSMIPMDEVAQRERDVLASALAMGGDVPTLIAVALGLGVSWGQIWKLAQDAAVGVQPAPGGAGLCSAQSG